MIGKRGKVGSTMVKMKGNLGGRRRGERGGVSEGAAIAIHGLNTMDRTMPKGGQVSVDSLFRQTIVLSPSRSPSGSVPSTQ